MGSALNVNVHGHALVLDGVFAEEGAGALRFHPAPQPTNDDMDARAGGARGVAVTPAARHRPDGALRLTLQNRIGILLAMAGIVSLTFMRANRRERMLES